MRPASRALGDPGLAFRGRRPLLASDQRQNPPERFTLATGIPCVYQKDAVSPTTVVGLFIAGGKSAVPPGLDGLAAVATRLLLEIPDEGKVRDLMAQATRLSYVCLEDCSVILIECLTENLEEALRVAAKIIQDPLVSGLRVGRAKELMASNAKIEDDDAVAAGRNAVLKALFGGRGYGSALYGTEPGLKSIDRKDVLGVHPPFRGQVERLLLRRRRTSTGTRSAVSSRPPSTRSPTGRPPRSRARSRSCRTTATSAW